MRGYIILYEVYIAVTYYDYYYYSDPRGDTDTFYTRYFFIELFLYFFVFIHMMTTAAFP
jgi:hypothetical protein